MFIKKLFFGLIFSASLLTVNAQQTEFRPQIGVGTYAMSDLKGLLNESVTHSSFGLKTTQNFPAYAFYGLDVIQSIIPGFGLGLTSGFYSTGGRNHYADYSGSYREDILVNSINLGLIASSSDTLGWGIFYHIEVAGGIKFSSISMEEELKLTDPQYDNTYDFRSKGWWIQPQLRIGRNILGNFSCAAFAGYEFNLKSKMKLKENDQLSSTAKIDWSGIRTGISIAYTLKY
jgi:hypothetical protein